ncbi:hypothetical protein [Alkalibacter saccharofermentans]|uniref:Uncharacterized protein n=1 Tax=Alkalibacter saccharofermentans DSM 14828 TaxID=1120975 RepID=A0A1M4XQC2_9FIRM|nr:hypothetical protein [Alkalibacter saccharofermentans]SHE95621.1 hypothetical protein SAMN02746064_01573 [Alkalibacter saccharofermentans DSM 14828]
MRIQRIVSEYLNDIIVKNADKPSADKAVGPQVVAKLSDEIKAGIENQDKNLESARLKSRMTPTDVIKTAPNNPEDAEAKGKLESFEIDLAGSKGKKVHEFKATSANGELKRFLENIKNISNNKSGIMLLNTEAIELFDDLKVNFKLSDGVFLTLLDYEYLEQEGIEAVNYIFRYLRMIQMRLT